MADTERFEASPATVGEYLERRGVVPEGATLECRALGGGVSNRVVEVRWDGGCLVAKQPRPNLAVADDWPADVERVHNEAAAARAYADVLDSATLDARVPRVVFEDDADDVIAVECAPDGAETWKSHLLDGRVEEGIARAVGALLGAVHEAAADDDEVRAQFRSKRPFEQLRIDPYHRTTARRHPEVADAIREETDRVLSVDRTLVHGDYSPKNVLVAPTGEPWLIDFEVAHWGDPAFDVAFMCNHLFIKSLYNRDRREAYVDAAFAFYDAYDERVRWDVEAETVAELGVLMLARVDGKSPVEYVDEGPTADALRSVAIGSLREGDATLAAFADRVRDAGGRA